MLCGLKCRSAELTLAAREDARPTIQASATEKKLAGAARKRTGIREWPLPSDRRPLLSLYQSEILLEARYRVSVGTC